MKAKGKFVLYDDDGVSFNYEKGEYSLTELSSDGKTGTIKHLDVNIFNYGEIKWIFMSK